MSPSDVANLLDRKLDICFGHGDQNGNGVLEPADALALAARTVAALGEPFGSPKAIALFSAFDTFWQHLSRELDSNNDGKVTPLEWRTGLKRAFSGEDGNFEEGFRPLAQALFDLCDKSGDGKVQPGEFAAYHRAFGTSSANVRIAFEKLDRNGDGYLTVDELVQAWKEYYTSTDPEARGNWLYGDIFGATVWDGDKVLL
ncbi:calcium binding protein [Actinokineospora spheciospongiae]|uniref:Calcium binding protein n=1 Tax=Actinokineospora spheciospongiae TaxID=909613 RepID=W7IL55_9PSEU|nr:EF-hand domain-containing protein [Actinokineospora spheciospongiae]EWC61063.1 calcium binding protein [Actinokineospora spheciospongiae]PWW66775.1 EF hand domain-containing protein [Actinokineospora spheciospongiae]